MMGNKARWIQDLVAGMAASMSLGRMLRRSREQKGDERAGRRLKDLRLVDRIRSPESERRYNRLSAGWRDTTWDVRGHHQPRRTQIAARKREGGRG